MIAYVVMYKDAFMANVELEDKPEYKLQQQAIDKFLAARVFYFFRRRHWWNYYQWCGYKLVKLEVKIVEEQEK